MSVKIPTATILRDEGESIVSEIIHALLMNDAVATGKTLESLEVHTTDSSLLIVGDKSFSPNKRDNRSFVESGRGVGGVPPFTVIADWAIARGLAQSYEDEIIQAIRWKIAREGTLNWRTRNTRDIVDSVITDERIQMILDRLSEATINVAFSMYQTQIRN